MPYVDNTFYTNTYKGTIVPSSSFDIYALKASYKIKMLTLARSDDYSDTNDVKNATCALMDFYYKVDNNLNELTSERVGEYSANYKTYSQNETTEQKEFDTAFVYLGHTGLMSTTGITIGCGCYESE